MQDTRNPKRDLRRYNLQKGVVAFAVLGLALGTLGISETFGQASVRSASSGQVGQNPIQVENAKQGTTDWMLTNQYIEPDTW